MEQHPTKVSHLLPPILVTETPAIIQEGCSAPRLKAGEICPFCGQGMVDYDGMLILSCPVCGQKETGGWT